MDRIHRLCLHNDEGLERQGVPAALPSQQRRAAEYLSVSVDLDDDMIYGHEAILSFWNSVFLSLDREAPLLGKYSLCLFLLYAM